MDRIGQLQSHYDQMFDEAAILKKCIEQDRVYDFLVGFKPEIDQ